MLATSVEDILATDPDNEYAREERHLDWLILDRAAAVGEVLPTIGFYLHLVDTDLGAPLFTVIAASAMLGYQREGIELTAGFTAGYLSQEPQLNPQKDVQGNVEEAVAVRDRIISNFQKAANLPEGSAEKKRLLTFVVVGGGFAGIEAFAEMRCEVPGLRLRCDNVIPHSRGLGSSSAAIVGGICLARGLVAGGSLLMDDDAVFTLAARMEGHPDNVAPAFYGGFTIAISHDRTYQATAVAVDPRVKVLAFVPPEPLKTSVARGLLPDTVPHCDAVADAARSALLVVALSGRPELLHAATEDFLHQRYREPVMPESLRLVRDLRDDGVAAVISGAGPTVLAFVDTSTASDVRRKVPAGWDVLGLSVEPVGAQVTGGS